MNSLANSIGIADAKAIAMKAKGLIFFLVLAALLPLVSNAQLTYTTNNGAITITGFTGSPTNIVIPASTNGYPVTSIGFFAFGGCASLTNIVIPDSVTIIGDNAFEDCYCLTSISLGNGVTNIGYWAFVDCTNLTKITIPNSVINISDGAFQDCTSLTNITVAAGNPTYSSPNGVLFNKNQTTLVEFPRGYIGNYTIPNNATNIGEYAFSGAIKLTSVIIPNSVKNISEAAFFLCAGLTNVVIGTNITSIGEGVFENCTSLMSISIPNSVMNIGNVAFQSCISLTDIIIPSSVKSIAQVAFSYCTSLTNITYLGNAPTLGSGVFYDDSPIATVYYYYGTSGWGATYGGLPTVELARTPQIVGGANMQTNFSFTIIGTNGMSAVVEASTNLVDWQPVWTNTFSGASATFTDSQWTNYPVRYYRARF